MTTPTVAQARAWMAQWRIAATALAQVRAAELRAVDLSDVAEQLDQALWARIRNEPPSQTSGLVEQQRVFAQSRGR